MLDLSQNEGSFHDDILIIVHQITRSLDVFFKEFTPSYHHSEQNRASSLGKEGGDDGARLRDSWVITKTSWSILLPMENRI